MYRLLIKIDKLEAKGFEFTCILLKNFREIKRFSKVLDEVIPIRNTRRRKTDCNLTVKELYCELHSLIKEFKPIICFWGNDEKLWKSIVNSVSTLKKPPHNWLGLFHSAIGMSCLLTRYFQISNTTLFDFIKCNLCGKNITTSDVLLKAYNKFLTKYSSQFRKEVPA